MGNTTFFNRKVALR